MGVCKCEFVFVRQGGGWGGEGRKGVKRKRKGGESYYVLFPIYNHGGGGRMWRGKEEEGRMRF